VNKVKTLGKFQMLKSKSSPTFKASAAIVSAERLVFIKAYELKQLKQYSPQKASLRVLPSLNWSASQREMMHLQIHISDSFTIPHQQFGPWAWEAGYPRIQGNCFLSSLLCL